MKIAEMFVNVKDFTKKNQNTILLGVGIGMMWGAIVATTKAAPKARDTIRFYKERRESIPVSEKKERRENTIKMVGSVVKETWLPVVMGTIGTACIIGAHKQNQKRIAMLTAAYKLCETSFSEYKDKVKNIVDEKKVQNIREQITSDKIKKDPVTNKEIKEIITTGFGDVLCYDPMIGRYFYSCAEKINESILEVSLKYGRNGDLTLNEFYYEMGLPEVGLGEEYGWKIGTDENRYGDKVDISFTATLTDDNRPCLALDYGTMKYLGVY